MSNNAATVSPRRITGLLPQNVAEYARLCYTLTGNKNPGGKPGYSAKCLAARGIDREYIRVSIVSQVTSAPLTWRG